MGGGVTSGTANSALGPHQFLTLCAVLLGHALGRAAVAQHEARLAHTAGPAEVRADGRAAVVDHRAAGARTGTAALREHLMLAAGCAGRRRRLVRLLGARGPLKSPVPAADSASNSQRPVQRRPRASSHTDVLLQDAAWQPFGTDAQLLHRVPSSAFQNISVFYIIYNTIFI